MRVFSTPSLVIGAGLAALVLAAASPARAEKFTARLSGLNEIGALGAGETGAIHTPGTGTLELDLNDKTQTLTYSLSPAPPAAARSAARSRRRASSAPRRRMSRPAISRRSSQRSPRAPPMPMSTRRNSPRAKFAARSISRATAATTSTTATRMIISIEARPPRASPPLKHRGGKAVASAAATAIFRIAQPLPAQDRFHAGHLLTTGGFYTAMKPRLFRGAAFLRARRRSAGMSRATRREPSRDPETGAPKKFVCLSDRAGQRRTGHG